ncbi:FAD-dependent oxidoreductase, partial [Bradyrhizobium sp. PRIMUS42]|uniref:FAD-dependent oxidoreductase n=2 Tax=unclassified Bradyrhizobium TaxID=2631580 RepID=UPI001FF35403
MALSRTIVIAGAGIGGLTAALALANRGFRIVVLEKAERLEEVGAGLQLSPNASRVLVELGL